MMKVRTLLTYVAIPLIVILTIGFFIYHSYSESRLAPFPSVSHLKGMLVRFYDGEREVEFNVPREYWQKVIDALQPATLDEEPARWEILGTMNLTMNDGQKLGFALFWTGSGPGAFKRGDRYHRGGDSRQLNAVLKAAYASSKSK